MQESIILKYTIRGQEKAVKMKGAYEEMKGIQYEYIWLLTGKQICINEATSSANIIKVMSGSRGGEGGRQGVPTPPPPPLKIHKAIGF